MNAMLYLFLAVSVVCAEPPEGTPGVDGPWAQVRELLKHESVKGNPERVEFMQSLNPEEMVTAARQACAEANTFPQEEKRAYAGQMWTMFCLEYYFEKVQSTEGGRRLLRIVGDREESPWLRYAIVSLLSEGSDTRVSAGLSKYAESHEDEILAMLSTVVADRENHYLLRTEAMSTIGQTLRMNVSKITRADANVRAVWERTHKVVPVGEMVRAGELTLSEDTWEALKPIEERIRANAKVLGVILGDSENEPEAVRARAKSTLKAYQRLPLTEKAWAVIDKVLQNVGD